jgi:DNA-binding IclR family transcriptional regulator
MGTVTKALTLLTFFNHGRREIGLSDMTRLSGMNKATVYRMLTELQACGFVEQAGNDRAYRLGPEVMRLAALREAAVPILSASRAELRRLSDTTHETSHLSLVRGDQLYSLTHAYSNRYGTRVMMEDAEILSFHGTASGMAVLAFSEPAFIEQVLEAPLDPHTSATITDPTHLRDKLTAVRATGIAESIGGFEADVHSHAAPVFDARGLAMGAIAVAAPVDRMTGDQQALIRSKLRRAARDLTQTVGGFCPPDYGVAQAG